MQPSFAVEQRERLRGLAFNQAGESFALAGFDDELPVTLADDLAWIEHVLDQVPARKLSPDQCQVGTDRAAATGDRVTLGAGDTAVIKKNPLPTGRIAGVFECVFFVIAQFQSLCRVGKQRP